MIRPADRSDLLRLSCADPFYTRILSVFESYGDVPFADCWVQDIDAEIASAVSRFEDKFSLYPAPPTVKRSPRSCAFRARAV